MAKLPSVAITFGSISSIWRKRCGSHASISSGCGRGSRAGDTRDVRDVDVVALEPEPPRSSSSSFPAWPTNGTPCLSSWKPGASPTNIRSACGLPEPKTTCVRPCASRQRVQLAVAPRTPPASHGRDRHRTHGAASLRGAPDGHDPRPPAAARRLDLDLVARRLAQQRPPDRRVGRNAADAGDLDLEPLAVVALELDRRADGDDAARRGRLLVEIVACWSRWRSTRSAPRAAPARSSPRGTRSSRRGRRAPAPSRSLARPPCASGPRARRARTRALVRSARQQLAVFVPPGHDELVAAAAGAAAAASAAARGRPASSAPCTAKEENWRETFVAAQSGHATCSSPRTSSSKCDSHSMQTYS